MQMLLSICCECPSSCRENLTSMHVICSHADLILPKANKSVGSTAATLNWSDGCELEQTER